ncbi:beta-glucosidase B [Aspergillus desertorum]
MSFKRVDPKQIESVLSKLSLEEKISLLAGKNFWETQDYPEKGVPSVKTSDGPNGARGATFKGGVTAACFPASSLLAATWDLETAKRIGNALADETRSKGARVLLAPTVCINRHPLGGRNFESFSEDPFLAGKLAAQYIQGLQDKGVAATIKHFAANEQETSNPLAVMTAYNIVNGTHADSNSSLLRDVLRGEWGWKGLVMSDWGGTNSTVDSLSAGLDLEMPGPTRWRKVDAVLAAVKSEIIRSVESQGLVLLKNEGGVLPLKKEKLAKKKIARLGFAREALIHGGGSASVNAHYRVTPAEGVHAALGDTVEFEYVKGAHTFRQLSLMGDNVINLEGQPGWTLDFFMSEEPHGEPGLTSSSEQPSYMPLFVKESWGSVRASAHFTPTQSGKHYFGMSGLGRSKLLINGELIYEQKLNCPDSMGFLLGGVEEPEIQYSSEAGKAYAIEVVSMKPTSEGGLAMLDGFIGFRLGFMSEEEHDRDLLSEAVDVAKRSDVAIVFTGHTPEWETEGQDQISFHLPSNGSQNRLEAAVGAANANTVVVNCTGVAVAMPWLDKVKAVVQAWFPGQEAGIAIADVLAGAVNPSGRLPVSFPRTVEDAPAHGNFPGDYTDGKNGRRHLEVTYREGVFVGYRHYDLSEENRAKVLFPFGYASATSGNTVEVAVDVTNAGNCAGAEVVQVYAGSKVAVPENPVTELVGFAEVHLEPGETKAVSVAFEVRQLTHFNERSDKWELESGLYEISIGQSVKDITGRVEIRLEAQSYKP